MKRVIYLSFYFKPDLCAGSFRNTPLAFELAKQSFDKDIIIDVYSTLPNRYSTFDVSAQEYEEIDNLRIHRISLPPHKSGMFDQVISFWRYYSEVIKLNKNIKADLVFASSSRLFTAYLGFKLAKKYKAPLYLDIRDIFVDTMNDVFKSKVLKFLILPFLKIVESKTFNYAYHINLISEGFKDYFSRFKTSKLSYFTNGIDEEFISRNDSEKSNKIHDEKKVIVYAGNIGEGQGLHKIIPQAGKKLGDNFEFVIIGDGGTKKQLESEIVKQGIKNVLLIKPVSRKELKAIYEHSDYLFLHLNDYPAFRKVLPSKIFELATFNKPIIAGVAGYSAEFIKNEVSDSFVFDPCNVNQLVDYLRNDVKKSSICREVFLNKYKRSNINEAMAKSILTYL